MTRRTECSVCGGDDLLAVLQTAGLPVVSNRTCDTRQDAMEVPTAGLDLAFCRGCGHLFNVAFEPSLVDYAAGYENSLHFSPHFQRYADDLVADLVRRYALAGSLVVDIGCGRAEFLTSLCRASHSRGVGFDPSQVATPRPDGVEVTVVPEHYGEVHGELGADLVCCRHCLEHVETPVSFLGEIHLAARQHDTPVFFEVPNGLYMMERGAVWDLVYEHCEYFTPASLREAFLLAGFEPLDVKPTYDAQFLTIHARTGPGWSTTLIRKRPRESERAAIEALEARVREFSRLHGERVLHWVDTLEGMRHAGRRVVVWGAGSKGVTFLNSVGHDGSIRYVVDLNPRKAGRFVPGSGQQIVMPGFLKTHRPDVIVAMNPVYRNEIAEMARSLGLEAEVLVA